MAKIVIVDDDLAMDMICDILRFRNHDAYRINSATTALQDIDRILTADLVVLDIIMPWPSGRVTTGMSGAHTAGMEVFREIRKRTVELPIIIYSASQDALVIDAIRDDLRTSFLSKWETGSIKEVIQKIHDMLGITDTSRLPQAFIVHGHNENIKLALKNFLQDILHLPEPIILHEKPNLGRTIIEKFEDYAEMSSLIFVILTPEDIGASSDEPDTVKHRARQNVIFEMGYFLGLLGRRSGRIFLLYNTSLELPSDLSGVIYIDITAGIETAGEEIRREVENVRD